MSCPRLGGVLMAVWLLAGAHLAHAADVAELVGRVVVQVQLYRAGVPVTDRSARELLETRQGQPLSLREVRESLAHLYSLGEYADVRVSALDEPTGVVLQYDLIPQRAVETVDVRGDLGRSPEELRNLITRRFGPNVRPSQAPAVSAVLNTFYRDWGRFAARIVADVDPVNDRLVFDVDQGPLARITRIDFSEEPLDGRSVVLSRLDLTVGESFDPTELDRRLSEYETDMRARRYYEAEFNYQVSPSEDGQTVALRLELQGGPLVSIRFERDPVPDASLEDLVPVAREGSIDEDLLEDSSRRVEAYLRALGYRDATVVHRRLVEADGLAIVFSVDRGVRSRLTGISFSGNEELDTAIVADLMDLVAGGPLVVADIEAGLAAVTAAYARLGYRGVQIQPRVVEEDPVVASGGSDEVPVRVAVEIIEGGRTIVGAINFDGGTVFDRQQLAALVQVEPGSPYYAPSLLAGADLLLERYLNEGFEAAEVDVLPRFNDSGEIADVTFMVREGAQVRVDHVLVVGNRQISSSTIRAELAIEAGAPLGRDKIDQTLRNLTALGLFRRTELRQFSHGRRDRRDVVVMVEEAPSTRIGYGSGLQATQRLRATVAGPAAERLEFAPRGFFEIGRRNLWGKNRAIDLFTRVSLRRKNSAQAEQAQPKLGFNEYRVLLNYQEPRAFRESGDLLLSGFVQQVIRPSFDLFSRGINAELRREMGLGMIGRVAYTYGVNRVTNEQLEPEEVPLVDRLFPEVTLSSFAGGMVRDTRDDPLETTRGTLIGVDGELALSRLGSEVGFAKTTVQGYLYRRLPGDLVLAAGARLGVARGFALSVPTLPTFEFNEEGVLVLLKGDGAQDLPASERFFAGGDTSVRGFALDRLGDASTIDVNGFPSGGNAMIVLNSELRVPVSGPLQVVGFLDAGNVFDRVSNLELSRIRGAAGFGVRYRSPVGPIRVDLGFKLDRRTFAGARERLTALHLSIGQAF